MSDQAATPEADGWGGDPVVAVFKIGVAEHIEELLDEGCVFMNTAAHYVGLEATDPRSDPYEGAWHCTPATGAVLSMQVDSDFQEIATLTGPIMHTSDELRTANLFCTHARRNSRCGGVFSLNELKFGEAALLFLDYIEFLRRVTNAAHQSGFKVSYSLVEYVDGNTYNGSMGLFRKLFRHAHESEHRIALMPGANGPLRLHVGSLRDIAIKVLANDRLKLVRKS